MTLGLTIFTLVHVVISLIGILSGFVVAYGFLAARRLDGWTATFLASTVLTSVTGFLFPFHHFLPSHGVGIISLVILAMAIFARYSRKLAGAWRTTYVVAAMVALYLNVFVLVVQLFQKVPVLNSDGSDAVRAAVRCCANRRSGAFRDAFGFCGDSVPPRAASRGLIRQFSRCRTAPSAAWDRLG